MGKKRNRQPDANEESSGESTESYEEITGEGMSCPHVTKAINIARVRKILRKTGINTECSACKRIDGNSVKQEEEWFAPLSGPLWICIRCGNQACGRNQRQHAQEHYETPHSDSHCLVVDTHEWSVWCYQCETRINSGYRKQLLEIVEFLKKLAATTYASQQPKMPAIPCQMTEPEINKEKQQIPSDLPKVGGLLNLGNTCFFNAVLQCLAQTPFLIKVLNDLRPEGESFVLPGGKHKGAGDSEKVDMPPMEGSLEGWGNFTSILCKTLTEMQTSNGHQPYRPSELLSSFRRKTLQCTDGGQHDSHELLRYLLELVRNEDLKRYQRQVLKQVGLCGKIDLQRVDVSLKSRVKYYGNQASARLLGPEPVFRGVLVSTLECLECHHSSQRTEPFLDLSLPVMADKPQPPILKRKNSGLEDAFDMMDNITSNAPSKHQLKKEKKNARKYRKNRREHGNANHESCLANNIVIFSQNSIIEEKQGNNPVTEESDADVEDNIETEGMPRPEIGESGYSSEKVSAVASPVSPADHKRLNQSNESVNLNCLSVDNTVLLSPTDNSVSIELKKELNTNTLNTPSPTDVSMMELTQVKLTSESFSPGKLSIAVTESPASPNNENGLLPVLSLSNSLAVNSDLTSPEGLTISPLSSPITSKDSPISPVSSAIDGDYAEKLDRPISRLELIEPELKCDKEESSRKSVPDLDTDEFQSAQSREDDTLTNSITNYQSQNGISDITTGLSKIGLGSGIYQSPTRYHTKEGECSIQSCLNQFTALELMSGSNKVSCEACTARENKGKEDATKIVCTPSTKQYLILRAPAVLILHLKRFQAQRVGFRKVTKTVSFPTVLDLSPVCKDHKKPRLYSLYGIVEHSGTLHGGHYVAYVKARQPLSPDDPRWSFLPSKDAKECEGSSSSASSDSEGEEASARAQPTAEPPPGRWYYVSDSRVMEVDESTVLQSQAYLLFYERIL
ncbi:ubiquitin carboxyl-terminal hydrolase 16 [Cephus cinctus]|uniref:Ubiquitin carboxyl-terminal hydrolase n=1 Tax=Cephus cinctus TaxID=211228 RepID=A0AAJ7CA90_CEPCN|nr:ubiquitin carboxyl-terminal hydrolase 16 [Cephus cinctus]